MLVEDSLAYARLVELLLEEALGDELRIDHFDRLGPAAAHLQAHGADCVLLDLSLPDSRGLESLARLRLEAGDVPVVVLSGHSDAEVARRAVDEGAAAFVLKGEEERDDALAGAVRRAVARRPKSLAETAAPAAGDGPYLLAFDSAPVGMALVTADGAPVRVNRALAELVGFASDELMGRDWTDLVHPDDRADALAAMRGVRAGDDARAQWECRCLRRDGETLWVRISMSAVRDGAGAPSRFVTQLEDVTDRRAAEQALQRQQLDLLAVAALAREAGTADEPFAVMCRGAQRILGTDFTALYLDDRGGLLELIAESGLDIPLGATVRIGARPSTKVACLLTRERVEIDDIRGNPAVSLELAEATRARTVVFEPVMRGAEVLGVLGFGWQRHVPVGERQPIISRMLAAELGAVAERRQLLDRLRDLARTDPLTGLPNRRVWEERVELERDRAQRHGRPLCVAMVDLDRFKDFNDTHGHQAGDRLLREVTAAWRSTLRTSDELCRVGGDEFAVLLPDCSLDRAAEVVDRLRGATTRGHGCSAGVVEWRVGDDAGTLMQRADEALYASKAAGRGRTQVG